MFRLPDHLLFRTERQCFLHRQTTVKSQTSTVSFQDRIDIHDLRLKRIEAIQTDRDQVVEQFIYIPATMNHHIFTRSSHPTIHPFQAGIYKLFPQIVSHDQADLLSPVISEIYRIDIIFECFFHLSQIIIANRIQQIMNELGIDIKVHQLLLLDFYIYFLFLSNSIK